jgi:hypothetical protein
MTAKSRIEVVMKVWEKCGSVFEDQACELNKGHRRKHRDGGVSWSDEGAARVAKDAAKASERKKEN